MAAVDTPLHAACAVRTVGRAARWPALVTALAGRSGFWWLDSASGRLPLGRRSFVGAEPWAVLRGFGERTELEVRRAVRPDLRSGSLAAGDPLASLSRLLGPVPHGAPPELPFVGGAVGWLGYELGAFTEGVAPAGRDDVGLPDLCLLGVDRLLALDPLEDRVDACVLGFGATPEKAGAAARGALEGFVAGLARDADPRATLQVREATPAALETWSDFDAETYGKAVRVIQERIEAGCVYQANLTHRIELPFAGDPWRAYRILRERNPAPFGAYLALPEVAVLSSSPERFLSLDRGGRVESRPIKGTRRREVGAERDGAAAAELARSEKDRAENLMIVDLVRNDLGRVCETGSVHVPELQVIEPYATVHQMVSTVRGRLRAEAGPLDLLRATFPPGSMTGAPKRAAMELLAGIEPVRRGVYSGALGWLDPRGALDLSVVIRTALVTCDRAYVHAGGAVVADSDPAAEWHEARDKATPLLTTLSRT